jgi:microcystin-dependent protein
MVAQDGGLVPGHMGQDTALPPGIVLPYAGSAAPNGWLLCYGQAVSRITYATLFAAVGTTYGVGDGSTTFNLPDARGRVIAGRDNMGGTDASRLGVTLSGTTTASSAVVTGLSSTTALSIGMLAIGANIPAGATIASIDSATQVTLSTGTGVLAGTASIRFCILDSQTLGASGGIAVQTLTAPQIPSHTHTITGTSASAVGAGAGNGIFNNSANLPITTNATGGGQAHPNVQPTLMLNKIIKT